MSADYQHSCGIRETGEVACWGWNNYGQANPQPGSFQAVSAGYYHTCGIGDSGGMRCWGIWLAWDDFYDFGDRTYRAVSAGFRQTCAVRDTGGDQLLGGGLVQEAESTGRQLRGAEHGLDARLRDSRVGRTRVLGRERSGQGSSGASVNP